MDLLDIANKSRDAFVLYGCDCTEIVFSDRNGYVFEISNNRIKCSVYIDDGKTIRNAINRTINKVFDKELDKFKEHEKISEVKSQIEGIKEGLADRKLILPCVLTVESSNFNHSRPVNDDSEVSDAVCYFINFINGVK